MQGGGHNRPCHKIIFLKKRKEFAQQRSSEEERGIYGAMRQEYQKSSWCVRTSATYSELRSYKVHRQAAVLSKTAPASIDLNREGTKHTHKQLLCLMLDQRERF